MNKRQLKKRNKKRLPVIADEYNLLLMTDDEREEAIKGYQNFVEKYAYRKKYKDLKRGKYLRYFYPLGKQYSYWLTNVFNSCKGYSRSPITVTQNLSEIRNAYQK